MIATYVPAELAGWPGEAALYAVAPPVVWYSTTSFELGSPREADHVIVAAVDEKVDEVNIFPATASGIALSLVPLSGSYVGGEDLALALVDAGYLVVGA